METRSNHIWVGLVTLLLLLGAALLTMWIAGINRSESAQYDIFFKQSVDGLAKGSEVSFSGVPSGQVKDIELWERDPEFVRVRITVDKKVPILEGTTASVQGSFTGVSTIQLTGAHKGAPPIECPETNPRATCPEGVPVIPTRRSGLGEILSNAPLLLERLATLTERLTMVLSDKNQKSFENILANTDRLSGNLADAAPDVKRTMAELQATLRQANYTLASFEKLTNSADSMLNDEGNGLAKQLRQTLKSAQGAADELQGTLSNARPAARQLNERTLPAAEAAIRDLQATTRSLREVTDKLNDKGIGGFVGGPKLPDYKE
ncbi:MAG: MlaD family protein [Novosphingobium sp.]|nr:MlaD family protein [Novosphingobium sp.]